MDSFYGGQPGVDFVLRKSFLTYDAMVAAFKSGPAYTDVWFNEYCILDTVNKNDADNGKIYQRGLNYSDANTGGAIYIGQIVGPSSGTPFFQMDTVENVKQKSVETLDTNEYRRFPYIGKDEQGNDILLTTDGSDKTKTICELDFNKSNALVPGKDSEGNFNDNIKYTWCNIRKDNADADSWFYVGFEIPYTIIDFESESYDPYNASGRLENSVRQPDEVSGREHPFYTKWKLKIPKGIKGDQLENFRLVKYDDVFVDGIETIYKYDNENGLFVKNSDGTYARFQNTDEDRKSLFPCIYNDPSKCKIWVADYRFYDNVKNGEVLSIKLGDYNEITNVTLDEDTGEFKINYSYEQPYSTNIDWIKNITIDESTGDITLYHAYKDKMTNVNGEMVRAYGENGEQTFERLLKMVTSVKADTLTYDNASGDSVTKGRLTFNTNAGTQIQLENSNSTSEDANERCYDFKTVDNISLQSKDASVEDALSLLGDQKIYTKYYPTGIPDKVISEPINFVKDAFISDYNFNLYILFNDKNHRNNDEASGDEYISLVSRESFFPQDIKDKYAANEYRNVCWRSFGKVKDEAGVLIGFDVTQAYNEYLASNADKTVIEYLNETYPIGLHNDTVKVDGEDEYANVNGKTVTCSVSGDESSQKQFYAFDYKAKSWYYLGSLLTVADKDVIMTSSDVTSFSGVSEKGLVVQYKTYAVEETNPLGACWDPCFMGWFWEWEYGGE